MSARFSMMLLLGASCLALPGCGGGGGASVTPTPTPAPTPTPTPRAITGVTATPVATFTAPWSMTFLPDGQMLVTERPPTPTTLLNPTQSGSLRLVSTTGAVSAPIEGLPLNVGLLDVKLDPDYANNHLIYVSYMERDPSAPRVGRNAANAAVDPAGLALVRGTLRFTSSGAYFDGANTIWRQTPKIVSHPGSGEPGGRIAFSPDRRYLYLTAGDRQELDRNFLFALDNTLGKTIRLYPDGTIPSDNPYAGQAGAKGEIWSLGHRNAYGLAFDSAGALWSNEMGPMGGDEFNRIERGSNYGWPAVSYGDNYGGAPIPKPAAGDGYAMSAYWWTPVIAPADMIFYSGTVFADWRGDAIIAGLQSKGLVRVRTSGTTSTEVQRIDMGARIRAVQQGPDGALWVLEDQPSGRLLKLAPVFAP